MRCAVYGDGIGVGGLFLLLLLLLLFWFVLGTGRKIIITQYFCV